MIFNIGIQTVIFKLLNFALLSAVIVWAFKRYVYPIACEEIIEREAFVHALTQQQAMLHEKAHTLDKSIAHQKAFCSQTSEKLRLWREVVHMRQERLHEELKKATAKHSERMHERHQSILVEREYRAALNRSLERARTELKKVGASSQAERLFNSLIDALEHTSHE